jgi:hypothetical protein
LLYGNNQIEELLAEHKISRLIFQLFRVRAVIDQRKKETNQIKRQSERNNLDGPKQE